jgi:hypothetical protein
MTYHESINKERAMPPPPGQNHYDAFKSIIVMGWFVMYN